MVKQKGVSSPFLLCLSLEVCSEHGIILQGDVHETTKHSKFLDYSPYRSW